MSTREDRGFGVGDGGAGDLVGLTPGEGRLVLGAEPADVEVIDDVLEQVERVLRDVAAVLHVADDPQTAERLEAEAVGGRDGGRVEVGQRMREPVAADAYLVGRAGGQELHDIVGGDGLAVEHARESLLGLQEAARGRVRAARPWPGA